MGSRAVAVEPSRIATRTPTRRAQHARHRRRRSATPVGWLTSPVCRDGLIIGLYLALAIACYWNAWSVGFGSKVQQSADVYDSIWYLAWFPHAVFHGHNPFFSDYANYPYGINLMVSTSVFLLGLLATPLTLLAGPITSYYVLATLSFAGSATAAYYVIRRWVPWRPAAAVGGLIYGFSPFEIGEGLGHLFLMFAVIPPLIFLLLHEVAVVQRGSPYRRGLLLGVLAVAQFFVSLEVMATSAVMGLVLLIILAVAGYREIRPHLPYLLKALATAALFAGACLAYPSWVYLHGRQHINGPLQTVAVFRADLLGVVVPDSLQWLAPSSLTSVGDKFGGDLAENGSYLGIILVLVLVVGCAAMWRSRIVRVVAIFGLVAWVLSLGSRLAVTGAPAVTGVNGAAKGGIWLPEALLAKLPVVSQTLPVRYSMYVALSAGFLLAVLLNRLHELDAGSLWRHLWIVLLAAACLIPLVPEVPYPLGDVPLPSYFSSAGFQQLPRGEPMVVYPFPLSGTDNGTLWQAQTHLRFRLVGGFFLVPWGKGQTVVPTAATATTEVLAGLYDGDPPAMSPALQTEIRSQLGSWGIHTIVAFPYGPRPISEVVSYLTALLGTKPVHESGAYAWYNWRPPSSAQAQAGS